MRKSAAVLCQDQRTLGRMQPVLDDLRIELVACSSQKEALESVLSGRCSTLIVDFDLSGAEEVMRMAGLLPASQQPRLLAVASRAWPGTGQAFQSGAGRILYRPLQADELKDALAPKRPAKHPHRRSARYEMKALVDLEIEERTLQAITIDISEHGLALQASEPIPMTSNLVFRCLLPGTDFTLHGHADVIWASERGRAGLFFSQLAPTARKHLQDWLHKRRAHKDEVRDLLPSGDEHVSFAVSR
jgi:response regulator RpfG family c-di-GMP phosphodiesterase